MRIQKVQRFIAPTIAVFLLVIGVVAGIVLVQSPQDFREQAAPATTVFITPDILSHHPGDTVNFSVSMSTGSNQMVGMDLLVSYDPDVLTVTSISKGAGVSNFDSVIRNTIDNAAGTISYSLFTIDRTKAVSGSNLVALDIVGTIKSTAPSGNSNITLLPQTSVAALTEGQNVIANKVGATLAILSGTVATGTPTTVPQSTVAPTNAPSSSGSSNGNSTTAGGSAVSSNKRGDLNGDGKINILDLSILLTRFLKSPGNSDLNGDGKTNILDLSIILSNWGK